MSVKRLAFNWKQEKREPNEDLNASLIRAIAHSLTLPLFLVDSSGAVSTYNNSTSKWEYWGGNISNPIKEGEILLNFCQIKLDKQETRCLKNCSVCSIRQLAMVAIENKDVLHKKDKFCIYVDNTLQELRVLLTATPVLVNRKTMAMVLVQDISLVTELQGLLPSCSSCGNIRNKRGEWLSIEKYVEQHSEACFTHDTCPECLQRYLSSQKSG